MGKLRLFAAAALVSVSGSAAAETQLAAYPVQFIVIEPRPASTVELHEGDMLLAVPLHWQQGATYEREIEVRTNEQARLIKPSQILPLTKLAFDSPEFSRAISHCTPRDNNVLATNLSGPWLGSLGLKAIKSGNDTQFCLIDKDGDGQADHSVMINDGNPAARMPVPIKPVAYSVKVAPKVGIGNELRIVYHGKYRFELQIYMDDEAFAFSTLTTSSGGRQIHVERYLRGEKLSDTSQRFDALGIPFLAHYDKATKSMRIEWSALNETIIAPIPDTVKNRYRYY